MKKYLRPEMELTKLSALSVLASSIEDNVYDDGDASRFRFMTYIINPK